MFPHSENLIQDNKSEQLSNKGGVKKRRMHEESVIETYNVKIPDQTKHVHTQREQNTQTKPEGKNGRTIEKQTTETKGTKFKNRGEKQGARVKSTRQKQNKRSAKTEEEKKEARQKKTQCKCKSKRNELQKQKWRERKSD